MTRVSDLSEMLWILLVAELYQYHVRLLHKFDKLQTYIKEMTKLDNIKYCDNDIVQDDKND